MSIGGGSSSSESESSSSSRPTTPEELEDYFNKINQISGGKLGNWATGGTQQTHYNPLTQGQLQALGGAGATQKATITTNLEDQLNQIGADSSLTYAQRQRSNQLANQDATKQLNAVDKEVEAAMSALASQEALRKYQSNLSNAQLTRDDLALLSQIFFGGKGQFSESSSSSSGNSWNVGVTKQPTSG